MRLLICGLLSCMLQACPCLAQSPEPPLDDERLTIHTLLREDIFSGWRSDNRQRLERAENNLERLLESRPDEKADLLAWKGGIALYRAALASETGDEVAFEKYYEQALQLFSAARRSNAQSGGVAAVTGGSYVMFADRLPERVREAAWQAGYENYRQLETMQAAIIDKLPTHQRGELLTGLAQSALKTGRTAEYEKYLDQIIQSLAKTPYGRLAAQWREDPQRAGTGNLSCKTCHAEGRLKARLAQLDEL